MPRLEQQLALLGPRAAARIYPCARPGCTPRWAGAMPCCPRPRGRVCAPGGVCRQLDPGGRPGAADAPAAPELRLLVESNLIAAPWPRRPAICVLPCWRSSAIHPRCSNSPPPGPRPRCARPTRTITCLQRKRPAPTWPGQATDCPVDQIEVEHDNLRAAVQWLLASTPMPRSPQLTVPWPCSGRSAIISARAASRLPRQLAPRARATASGPRPDRGRLSDR